MSAGIPGRRGRPGPARIALVAVPLALLTACAPSTGADPAGGDGTAGARPATSGPTADQNRAAAQAEADRLVADVVLPAGTVELDRQPTGLPAALPGVPLGSQVIDTARFVGVPMSLSQTRTWFQEHSQPGLASGGSSSSSGPSTAPSYGLQFVPTSASPAWGDSTLDVSLVARGSDTAVRIDGVARWIDPTPVEDTPAGPTGRVTVAAGCPPSDRDWSDIANPGADDLDARLLPDAEPTAAVECVYGGTNGDPFTLQTSHHLDAAGAAAAAVHLAGIGLGSRGDTARSCPADDSRATIIAFGFPGRDDVDIWQHTSGCGSTDNGHIVADGL